MLYIYHGPDSFSRHEAVLELKREMFPDGSLASGLTTFDGRNVTAQEIAAACNTPPFFSEKRLVMVEGLFQRLGRGGPRRRSRKAKETDGEGSLGPWKALVECVDTLPETTTLLFVEEDLASGALFDELKERARKSRGEVREFRSLKWGALPEWVRDRAQGLGLKMDQRTASVLIGIAGNDLWALAGELEKLAVYAGGKPIREKDVRLLAAQGDIEIWAYLDALVEGRYEAALRVLRRLFDQTKDAGYILQMTEWQYRQVALAREMLDEGHKSAEIARRLNVQDWKVERVLDQAARWPMERLKRAFRAMVEADASIKRGIYDPELALEILTYELTSRSGLPAGARHLRPGIP